jgi:cytochrome c oxidase subunit 2
MTKHGWAHLAALVGLVASGAAFGAAYDEGMTWNMPLGVTEISRDVFKLHMQIFWVCVGIGVVVFGVMFYSLFAHRRSRHPKPADFHESTSIEILWTVIPFAILVAMAVPAATMLIRMEDMRGSELSIKVTGYQWKWQYEYVDKNVSFYSTLHADSNYARQLHAQGKGWSATFSGDTLKKLQ